MRFTQLLVPGIEITTIAVVIYYLLSFFWNTRSMDLIAGLLAFFTLFAVANWFHFPVLQRLMLYVVNVAVIALLILFQPELRLALSRLGVKGKKNHEMGAFDKFVDALTHAIYRMSEKRIGALVLLENQDSLEEYANGAVRLDANFSPELLESLFSTTTPLHDGAVIIRGSQILSAATILPLAEDTSQILKAMGTRHRAALGISQVTDALIIVVSEETGRVSIAREGVMTRNVKVDRFKGVINSVFNPPPEPQKPTSIAMRLRHLWKT